MAGKPDKSRISETLAAVVRPTLLIDEARARANIERMAGKIRSSGVRFRPHFKTHQSAAIGEWFRDEGVRAITVSSLDMARYFAEHGWDDITVAFPTNARDMGTINALAEKITLGLLVDSIETIERLSEALEAPAHIWVEIDAGYGRTGVPWERAVDLFRHVSRIHNCEKLHFQGLLTHAGHTYHASSPDEIRDIYDATLARMRGLKRALEAAEFGPVEISVGDTPACALIEDFHGVDEVRPGNFVFFDLTQLSLGVCREEDIAVALACPVVAKYPERREIAIHGGAVHLSKEFLLREDGSKSFGAVALLQNDGWGKIIPDAYVDRVSQEHGLVRCPDALLQQITVGDLLVILPVHSCLTANLMQGYLTLDGTEIRMAGIAG